MGSDLKFFELNYYENLIELINYTNDTGESILSKIIFNIDFNVLSFVYGWKFLGICYSEKLLKMSSFTRKFYMN